MGKSGRGGGTGAKDVMGKAGGVGGGTRKLNHGLGNVDTTEITGSMVSAFTAGKRVGRGKTGVVKIDAALMEHGPAFDGTDSSRGERGEGTAESEGIDEGVRGVRHGGKLLRKCLKSAILAQSNGKTIPLLDRFQSVKEGGNSDGYCDGSRKRGRA
jgi:hypothetical protein